MSDLSKYIDKYKTLRRIEHLIQEGRCPTCEFRFDSTDHADCEYWKDMHNQNHRQSKK